MIHSSVEQAHCISSFTPNSGAFDMMHDDTKDHAYRQNKSTQQKQYRDRETDGFAELRDAIRESTDDQEAPKTKYETLSKAAQHIRQLNLMNLKLQQQLYMLKSSRTNDEGHMMTQNPTVRVPDMSLHWNGDVRSACTHRTTQIVSQNTLHDFYIGMSPGVCDAAMLEGVRDQTSTVPRYSNSLNQIDQYTSFGYPSNQPASHISYDRKL
ncbi:uncharacterized protein F5147DRAFT_243361 [Suillus discolor]|uniref:BHLH domain-containing protein n=1 Tax=Suillus discolor TaxID=1912936 RepID=A0A9P7EQ38_9AGAM|nr:uncharacterized protein F5147DRAFT_243361 [Suillus discolor]KAG2081738.1 hypothetical protein F5147DRAFT_243361 [Suillus discolor]